MPSSLTMMRTPPPLPQPRLLLRGLNPSPRRLRRDPPPPSPRAPSIILASKLLLARKLREVAEVAEAAEVAVVAAVVKEVKELKEVREVKEVLSEEVVEADPRAREDPDPKVVSSAPEERVSRDPEERVRRDPEPKEAAAEAEERDLQELRARPPPLRVMRE